MSCSCGAQRMEECSTLADLAAEQLGADPSWADYVLTEPKWKMLSHATWCLLHPKQCLKDARQPSVVPGLAIFLLLAYGYWKLKDR